MSGQPVNLVIIIMAVPSCYGEVVPKGHMSTETPNVYVLIHVEIKFGG